MAGYSDTALARKLGLKDGQAVAFVGLPDELSDLTQGASFRRLEQVADWRLLAVGPWDVIHYFTRVAADLDLALPDLRRKMATAGMIWVSWPKKAARQASDVTEDVIRKRALADVLVDIKVCAVDEVWSGLKLVIRKEARAAAALAQGGA